MHNQGDSEVTTERVFPIVVPGLLYNDGSAERPSVESEGMELRDLFAGMAMQGLIASNRNLNPSGIATVAYQYADEMIKKHSESCGT